MKLEVGYFPVENLIPTFSDIKFETFNFVANKPKHVYRSFLRVKSEVLLGKKEKACSQKHNAENSVP